MKKPNRLAILVICLFTFNALSLLAQTPKTIAESSGFKATSRYQDVIDFIHVLQQQNPNLRVETLCTSAEGREVPMLVIGNPVPRSPIDLRNDDRAVVYFQANIHAGEVEGKEAVLMLARDILQGTTNDYLDKLVILLVPIFNPDGNEKISTDNRQNQKGPDEGVGIRYNGQNLDLNRDGMKLETPEVQGLIQNALLRWDPVFFFDAHTHNGSYHQEPVTWTWGLNPNGDRALLDYSAQVMWPVVEEIMREEHQVAIVPHGDFIDARNPEKGWIPLGPQPRYLSNYVGLRNRLSVLNENYPYADYETRVRGCYALLISFLDFLHSRKEEVVSLVKVADRNTISRGLNLSPEDQFIVEYGSEAIDRKFTIQGYEMEIEEREGMRPRIRPTEKRKTYSDVPYLAQYTSKRAVRLPRGYFLNINDLTIIGKIRQHGVAVERLIEPVKARVEAFIVREISPSQRLNQGHYTNTVAGEYQVKEVEFPAGTYYVSMAQSLASVASYLLEPQSDDGLVVWNFFDRYLAAQWSRSPQEYPVYKLYDPVRLVTR